MEKFSGRHDFIRKTGAGGIWLVIVSESDGMVKNLRILLIFTYMAAAEELKKKPLVSRW